MRLANERGFALAVAVLQIWVVAPEGGIFPLAPSGAVVAEDYLTHLPGRQRSARSAGAAGEAESVYAIRRALHYLRHRFPGRLRVYWVNPWSLHGLWFCWRNHVRIIPAMLFPDGRQVSLQNVDMEALRDLIAAYLAGNPSTGETP